MKKIRLAITTLTIGLACLAGVALAHHGWSWTTGNNIELIGIIREVSLGMPHGTLRVDAEGDIWTVQVGQPWRNEQAGLQLGWPWRSPRGCCFSRSGQPTMQPSWSFAPSFS